jgi:glycerate kinase
MAQLLAAPDKFRGTLTAPQAAAAIAAGAARASWTAVELPLADGGEGTLDVLGGGNQRAIVTGPLGEPVEAALRLEDDDTAVVESALACGLTLAGGPEWNDPLRATSRGVGELIHAALAEGADRIVVAVGGVASTDGGLGAVDALRDSLPLPVPLEVACDVDVPFLDAATVFASQKGATPEQALILHMRLEQAAERYRAEFGVDVIDLPGAGAAGGLAGGLAAIGARLLPGFDLVADRLHLDERLAEADFVVTGEGRVDATSFSGKVVGQVLSRAAATGVETLVVAGDTAPGAPIDALSLVARYGPERAFAEPAECLTELVASALATRRNGP